MRKYLLVIVLFVLLSPIAFSQQENFEGRKKINGTELYFSVKGKGDFIIVIHGGPGLNHSYFIPHLRNLENNFRVIYYDQRASGQSTIPSSDSISIKFFIEDIEAIRKVFNIEKLNILAHSWGCVLATHYALQYPGKIDKLILSNPAMLSHEYDQEAAALIAKNSTKEDSIASAAILTDGNLDHKDYEKLMLLSFRPSAYNKNNVSKINLSLPENFGVASNALYTSLMKDVSMNSNLYDSLPSLTFPVLIIHGQSDVIPYNSVERLNKKLPQSKVAVFKQSGHFPFVEETILFNERTIAFLKANH